MQTLAWRAWLALPTEMIGICHDDPEITAGGTIRYDACLTVRIPLRPRGELAEKIIPGGRHAVFLHRGPHALLPQTYDRLYGDWLPRSGERLSEAPAFELYLDHPDHTSPDRLRTLIHLPLVARAA
jgi:AraC family transcriptional regulator